MKVTSDTPNIFSCMYVLTLLDSGQLDLILKPGVI